MLIYVPGREDLPYFLVEMVLENGYNSLTRFSLGTLRNGLSPSGLTKAYTYVRK